MSTKSKIGSTGQSPSGSAENVSFVTANNQPVIKDHNAANFPV